MTKGRLLFVFFIVAMIVIAFTGNAFSAQAVVKGDKNVISSNTQEPIRYAQVTSSGVDESKLKPQYGGNFKMIWRRCPPKLGGPTNRSWGYVDGAYPVIENTHEIRPCRKTNLRRRQYCHRNGYCA